VGARKARRLHLSAGKNTGASVVCCSYQVLCVAHIVTLKTGALGAGGLHPQRTIIQLLFVAHNDHNFTRTDYAHRAAPGAALLPSDSGVGAYARDNDRDGG
jgi:hypothetical protein